MAATRYELSAVGATADVLAPLHRRHRSARLVALDAAGLALVPVTDKLLLALDMAGIPIIGWNPAA